MRITLLTWLKQERNRISWHIMIMTFFLFSPIFYSSRIHKQIGRKSNVLKRNSELDSRYYAECLLIQHFLRSKCFSHTPQQ